MLCCHTVSYCVHAFPGNAPAWVIVAVVVVVVVVGVVVMVVVVGRRDKTDYTQLMLHKTIMMLYLLASCFKHVAHSSNTDTHARHRPPCLLPCLPALCFLPVTIRVTIGFGSEQTRPRTVPGSTSKCAILWPRPS